MEGVPKNISFRDVKLSLERIKGVISVKTLRIWAITPHKFCMAAKILARVNTPVLIDAHEV